MKRCTHCMEVKSLDEFHNDSKAKSGKVAKCKDCVRSYAKIRYTENKPRINLVAKLWKMLNRERNLESNRDYHKGDKVIVRTFRGQPLIRRVWEVAQDVVFICSEENYKALSSGEDGLLPVGFPREYVYRYNAKIDIENVVWNQLNTYA